MTSMLEMTRTRYTNATAMLRHVEAGDTVLDRLLVALQARETAVDPRGKFGLASGDTAIIVPMLDGLIVAYRAALAPVKAIVASCYAEGLASDETRNRIESSEFAGLIGDRSLGYVDGSFRGA